MYLLNSLRHFRTVLLIALILTAGMVSAGAVEKYRLLSPGLPDAQGFYFSGAMVTTGPDTLLVLSATGNETLLQATAITASGKARKPYDVYRNPADGSKRMAGFVPIRAGDHVELFILVLDPSRATLLRIPLSSEGQPLAPAASLATAAGPVDFGTVFAARSEDEICIVFTTNQGFTYEKTPPFAGGFLLVTDLSGNPRKEIASLPVELHESMTYLDLRLGTPCWNGKSWMVPAYGKVMHGEQDPTFPGSLYYLQTGNKLLVFTATGRNGGMHITRKTLESQMVVPPFLESPPQFDGVSFVSSSPAQNAGAANPGNLKMIVKFISGYHFRYDDSALEGYDTRWQVFTVNPKGRRVGDPSELVIPEWNHRLHPQPFHYNAGQTDAMSDPVIAADGSVYLTHTRSLTQQHMKFAPDGSLQTVFENDTVLDIYRFERTTREISTAAEYRPNTKKRFLPPLAQPFADGIAVLNRSAKSALVFDYVATALDVKSYLSSLTFMP